MHRERLQSFLNYRNRNCIQVNKKFLVTLKRARNEKYSTSFLVNSFRVSPVNILANTDVLSSFNSATDSVQYSLDYETGHLRTSSTFHTSPPVSTENDSNNPIQFNGNKTARSIE